MTKEQSKDEKIFRLNYFFDLFLKRKKLYPASYFLFPTHTRKKKLPVSKKLFKSTIQTYLDIYFEDFYNRPEPIYFMLTGKLVKAHGESIDFKNGNFNKTQSIGWIWYLRPFLSYCSNIKLLKLKGSTSRVNKLDKKFQSEHDVFAMETVSQVTYRLTEQNKRFKQCKAE